jgi:hypothetical protein
VQLSLLPRGQGTSSSFYRPRGDGLQSCRTVLATCGGMAYNAKEWVAAWRILLLAGRRDKSYACPGAASRIVVWEPLAWLSSVRRLEGHADGGWKSYNSGCGDVLSSRAPVVLGMALQCLGWWHSDGDGRTGPEVTEETCSAGLTSRHCPA